MTRLLLGFAMLIAGCAGSTEDGAVPARLVAPSDAARAELRQVVAQAIGQTEVRLAEDALQRDGVLLLERSPHTDALGRRIPGRDLGTPSRFQLFVSGDRCLLRQADAEQSWALEQARCAPL